jgi:hypothetical protein
MKTGDIESLKSFRADLVNRQESLKKEIDLISRDIEAVDRMMARYGGQISLEINDKTAPVTEGEFANVSLREAVKTVLQRHMPKDVKASQIQKEIRDGGYRTTAKEFGPAIFVMLGKLISLGEAKKVKAGVYKMVEK